MSEASSKESTSLKKIIRIQYTFEFTETIRTDDPEVMNDVYWNLDQTNYPLLITFTKTLKDIYLELSSINIGVR